MVLLDKNTGQVLTSRSDEAGTTPLPLLDIGDMFDHGIDQSAVEGVNLGESGSSWTNIDSLVASGPDDLTLGASASSWGKLNIVVADSSVTLADDDIIIEQIVTAVNGAAIHNLVESVRLTLVNNVLHRTRVVYERGAYTAPRRRRTLDIYCTAY